MCIRGNVQSGKYPLGEITGRGNVQSEKRPVGEIDARTNVWSGKCQVGKVSVGKLSSRGCVSRGSDLLFMFVGRDKEWCKGCGGGRAIKLVIF